MRRASSLEETLMLTEIEGRRRRKQQSMRRLDGITDSMDMSLSKLRDIVQDRKAWHIAVHAWGRKESDMTSTEQHLQKFPDDQGPPTLYSYCRPASSSVICPHIVSILVGELLLFPQHCPLLKAVSSLMSEPPPWGQAQSRGTISVS